MTNLLEFRTRALCHVLVVATTAWLLTGCASGELIELGPARDGGGDPRDATDTTGRPDLGGDTIVSDTSSDSDVVTDVVDAVDANDGSGGDVVEDTDTFVPGCPGLGCACTPATAAALCEGYPCVDGFCCTDACDGACETCAAAGREGQCTPHAAATDPDNDCTEQPGNTCGLSGLCDGTGECAYWGSETYCNDNESCSTGDRCNGRGECRGEVPDECGPGPANECCAGTCADGAGCATYATGCLDVCTPSVITSGATCVGCGEAGAEGLCQGGATIRCDEEEQTPCAQRGCGGVTYTCNNEGGTWAWRTTATCDDKDACTYGDRCLGGACLGTTVDCADSECADRECNGTATCTSTPRTGNVCSDGDACTYNDMCNAAGACAAGPSVSCTDTPCIDRECNGTAACVETVRTGAVCDDGNACTWGDICGASGVCQTGTPISCSGLDTTCAAYACNGTSSCAATARNVGGVCDDLDPVTERDVCRADATCQGDTGCPPPAEACVAGTQNRRGCGNARVISRITAGGTSGAVINDDTCSARNDIDNSGSCYDAGGDHTYRIYLRSGETVTARYQEFSACDGGSWDATLKLYTTGGCSSTTCGTRVYCEDYVGDRTATHTATQDGWLMIVADGSTAFDDEGDYRLTVRLTCRDGNCTCP